ncbi:MAG TPA: ABC transporter permease [Vicinamibacterales bacterium]|nr:ABC transporter permease [Vicinamibacterales bacterium]
MDRLWQDIRYGTRLLIRFHGVTAAALLALALGTGVNIALFSIVNTVLLTPLPFPDADELVQVWRTELPRLQFGSASHPRYVDWRARNRVFEEMGAYSPAALTLTGRDAPERIGGGRATASFFRTLAAPPILGRYTADDEDTPGGPKVIVLGEQYWQRRFASDRDLLGQTLVIDGGPHTVIGIAPAAYTETWRADAWVPLARAVDQSTRGSNFLVVVGRLKEGFTIDHAQTGLSELAAEMSRDHPNDRYGFFTMSLHDVLTRGPRQALWILLGATGLVLLIACANVANLILVRAVTRQREIAVRTALGAGHGRIVRQLVTETVLLALVGGMLGVGLAAGLLRIFALVAPANFPRLTAISLDGRVLAFSLMVAALTGLIAAVIPALHAARAQPSDALREGSRGATAGRARTMSRLLVVGEIAMAVMLVAAAGLTIRSLQELIRQDLGLNTRGVLTFTVGITDARQNDTDTLARFFDALESRIRALPGVESAGAINMLPIAQTGMNAPVRVPERVIPPEESPLAELRIATPGYFDATGIPVLAGRLPDARDLATGPPVVAINETLARELWPGEPPSAIIGRRLASGFDRDDTWREVVGITRDVRSRRPDAPPDSELYVPFVQFPVSSLAFTVRTAGSPESLVPAIRSELAQLDPMLPMASVRTFDEVIAAATRNSRLYSVLTTLFGILAAALAIVGIYSVMSYTVAQRTRELAIRSALGASHGGLLRLVLREGFVMSAVGIAAGLAGAFGASQLIRALLYQVSPTDPFVFTLTAVAVAAAAALGYLVPAFRASGVEPAVALRAE